MKIIAFLLLSCIWLTAVNAQDKMHVAERPPMGWNSYNCYGSAVHEDEIKANADYMADKLKPFGWEYIVVDFLWSYDNPPGSNLGNVSQKNLEDGSFIPWLSMDQYGRLLPHPNKFQSAFNGHGFGPLADYVHGKGLKFGIHVMRGIPKQAVWARCPVLGTNGITADMIADTTSTCGWNNHMYGLDMNKKGAQEYLNSLLNLYADWQVDFVKVDDLSRPYSAAEVEGYNKAIAACRRSVVFSLSPGETPLAQAAHVARYGNMWRMAEDFWDNWNEVLNMFQLAKKWEGKGGPGHWPDADMLQIGKLSKRGPVGAERYSRFTDAELYSHMTFWCIYRSPLMLGGNLPENRAIEETLFTNSEVLKVNQHGTNPRELSNQNNQMIWVSDAEDGKAVYAAIFNLADTTRQLTLDFKMLNMKGKVSLRDLWAGKDLGTFSKTYQTSYPAHGCMLLKLSVNQ
ncbi:glycoside hydrolase family 27 protein [Deminuibacter soli]|uniref:Alpha-galactosidase n=1 Tax=Deminuibacter soli TaxID=2291815 RepID=A0A3E1NDX5_9BACT|nr:glycoside hydrolase family 27 protein [Deminuibacter soli]RFM26165.1 glycoside hydrolase family 27 protein [Deminuibacter soli]